MSKSFGKLFGEQKQLTQPTTFQTLPDFAQNAYRQSVNQATSLAQQPQLFAPAEFTPEQEQALSMMGRDFQPLTSEEYGQQLSMFQNPFIEQTLNPAIQDVQRGARGFVSDIGSGATEAGGFGGTRQATLEGLTQRNLLEEIGRLSGNLRSQAYESASDRALNNIGIERGLQRQSIFDLFGAGSARQDQATAEKQAILNANNYLAALAQGVPVGGGQLSTYEREGMLNRVSKPTGQFVGGFAKAFSGGGA